MAGLGWVGSYGATGASNTIADILKQRELDKYHQEALQQQQFQNQLSLRGADRADAAQQTTAQWHNDEVQARIAAQQAADGEKQSAALMKGREMLPPETALPEDTPYAKDSILRGTLRHVAPQAAMGADFQGPSPTGDTPEQMQAGHPGQYFTNATEKQTDDQRKVAHDLTTANETDARNRETVSRDNATAADRQSNQAWQQMHGDATLQETTGFHEQMLANARDKANNPKADNGRLDRSYQSNVNELNKVHAPIAAQMDRFDKLLTTMRQQTPSSDALVAPELLSAVAGGQGSGVRITKGELDSLGGARSHWQSLQAALNKWQSDPSKALLLTPEQRADMGTLVSTLRGKAAQRITQINGARQQLIDAQDPTEHRNIMAGLQRDMNPTDDTAPPDTGGGGTGFVLKGSRPAGK